MASVGAKVLLPPVTYHPLLHRRPRCRVGCPNKGQSSASLGSGQATLGLVWLLSVGLHAAPRGRGQAVAAPPHAPPPPPPPPPPHGRSCDRTTRPGPRRERGHALVSPPPRS